LKKSYLLLLILALALALRLFIFSFVAADPKRSFTNDAAGYSRIALNLLKYGVFSSSEKAPLRPESERTPGYPLFLLLVYALFGHLPAVVLFAQSLLGVATVYIIYRIGEVLYPQETMGLWASLLYALEPASILYSNYFLSETLFVFIMSLGFYGYFKFIKSSRTADICTAFFFLGIATLCRPGFIYFPLFIIFLTVFYFLRKGSIKEKGRPLLVAFAVYAAILGVWSVRYYRAFGEFKLTSLSDNIVFAYAYHYESNKTGITLESARERVLERCARKFPKDNLTLLDSNAKDRVLKGCGMAYIKEEGSAFVRGYLHSIPDLYFPRASSLSRLILGEDSMVTYKDIPMLLKDPASFPMGMYLLLTVLFLGASYTCALIGIFFLLKERSFFAPILACSFIAYYSLGSALLFQERYRVPIFVFIALLAAGGINAVMRRSSQ
jgi:4-amino-4-deoxy-L-arabinose transferase-like glycosyltransferase